MELRQLRYFAVVAEELHFGRAAARLHMTQPPLSTQMRHLERELGLDLLRRSTRRISLTPAGEHFYRRTVALLAGLDAAVEETREADAGQRGILRVGFVSSANYTLLPTAIRRFREGRPSVELALRPLTTSEQVEALHQGAVDIGLIRLPTVGTGLRLETVFVESLIAAVPHEHPLAIRAEIGVEDLAGEPMVFFPYGSMPGFVGQVLEMFDAAIGERPNIVQQVIHHETALGLVAVGVGVTILPASAARTATSEVRCIPIHPSPRSELAIALRPSERSPAVAYFVQCVRAFSDDTPLGAASLPK